MRANFAAIGAATGSLFFHHGAVADPLMVGIDEGEWFEGYCAAGTLTLIAAGDAAGEEGLARRGVLETPLELEMVGLSKLFRRAKRIFVPGKTALASRPPQNGSWQSPPGPSIRRAKLPRPGAKVLLSLYRS